MGILTLQTPRPPPAQVKPPVGLSTPRIFKSLDLARRSTADPKALLAGMAQVGVGWGEGGGLLLQAGEEAPPCPRP